MDESQGTPPSQITPHLPIERIFIQEMIDLPEHRIRVLGELRNTREDTFEGIAIHEHGITGNTGT